MLYFGLSSHSLIIKEFKKDHFVPHLSLRWAHMPLCWFCHEVAHINYDRDYYTLKSKPLFTISLYRISNSLCRFPLHIFPTSVLLPFHYTNITSQIIFKMSFIGTALIILLIYGVTSHFCTTPCLSKIFLSFVFRFAYILPDNQIAGSNSIVHLCRLISVPQP